MCLFVGLSVGLLFIGHTTFVHFAALPPSTPREQEPSSRAAPRARAQAHAQRSSESTRVHAVQLLNEKNRSADAFQKQLAVRARACCRIRSCREFQKKGKRKPTCHFPSSVYSLPSLGVFTFRIVLNRILHESSLLATIGRKRLRSWSLVGADLGQLVYL